jgi:reactive intermediate/imine deaminase
MGPTKGDPRRVVSTTGAPPPAGAYSQAVIAGGLVHIAGQTPRLPDGTRINDAPFDEQARQAFRNVAQIALACGTSLECAVSVTIFLRDTGDRGRCDEVWREFFAEPWPARAIVGSDLPGFAIEVVAVCALPVASDRGADAAG